MSRVIRLRPELEPTEKEVATLVARCALEGVVLHYTPADDFGHPMFTASKWAFTANLHSVEEVETFLRRIGGPNA